MAEDSLPPVPESPLRQPIFRAVWIASMASNFGALIQSVGASWMMTSLTSSPKMVALVQSSTTLPIMLLSLYAGAVADNLDRRKVMLCAQTFMLIMSTALAVTAWYGGLSPYLLLAFTFLIGCGTAFNGPAWQASVGDMVPRAVLPSAVALNSMAFNIARSVGPAIGGAIVAAAGAAAAFTVNAASYLGLITVLLRWRTNRPRRTLPREKLGDAMAAGVRYVAMSPNVRTVLLRAGLFGIAACAIPAMMPVVARKVMAGGPLTYGFLLGAFGVGAVSGAFLSGRLRRQLSPEVIVRLASIALAIGAAVTALSTSLLITAPALVLAGAGWVLALSTFNVTVQMATPRWVVARALALYQMCAFGGMAIGSWACGILASHYGVSTTLCAAAALQAAGVLVGLWLPLPKSAELNLDPLDQWSEPETAVPVQPRSGPIVVTIEYRLADEDIHSFLTLMNERSRVRKRDGARHWTLLRDLGESDLWIERYHVATWIDYIRHNQRRTQADLANSEAIRALHRGSQPPRVHRRIERQTVPPARTEDPREFAEALTDASRAA